MAELPSLAAYGVFSGVVFTVLLLASASPARRRLLEQAGIPHRTRVSGVDEDRIHHPDPAQLVQLLAQAKAQSNLKIARWRSALRLLKGGLRAGAA